MRKHNTLYLKNSKDHIDFKNDVKHEVLKNDELDFGEIEV